jgi:hypothetical protein
MHTHWQADKFLIGECVQSSATLYALCMICKKLYDADHEARKNIVNWYLYAVHVEKWIPHLFFLVVKIDFNF